MNLAFFIGFFLFLQIIPIKWSQNRFYKILTKYRNDDSFFCKCLGDFGCNVYWRVFLI